ncbi:MAG: glycosyltransferase [Cyanobacteria bacterium P01_E01_bin.6]
MGNTKPGNSGPGNTGSNRIAVIHEWLVKHAGSERVVEEILRVYPDADLFSLVDFLDDNARFFIQNKSVTTSFIQHLPFAAKHFRQYLPLMPVAIEQFDLSPYDIVISSNHAVAKGVLTRADQLHVSYVHTPIRYAWDLHHQYLNGAGLTTGVKGAIARIMLHYLRLWDVSTANRVDAFVANSRYVARRIWKTYRRQADVIYPPVHVDRFRPQRQRDDFYFVLSRFVPYKRVDLIVQAFAHLQRPLIVMGDGPDAARLQQLATDNVTLLSPQSDEVVTDYMNRCKAFVYAAEEDFGIAAVEAQAAGAPVIAFGKGGVTETVIPGKTGLFFNEQTVESVILAIKQFEETSQQFSLEHLQRHADQFSPERFQHQFSRYVDHAWDQFRTENGIQY